MMEGFCLSALYNSRDFSSAFSETKSNEGKELSNLFTPSSTKRLVGEGEIRNEEGEKGQGNMIGSTGQRAGREKQKLKGKGATRTYHTRIPSAQHVPSPVDGVGA